MSRRWKVGETRVFRWWPRDKAPPPGAVLCEGGPPMHHDHWSNLIELVEVENEHEGS